MRVPTVRIASLADPSQFIVINKSDLTEAHELWPEQAEHDDELNHDADGERLGRRVLAKLMAERAGVTADEWRALPLVVRVAQMQTVEAEMGKAGTVDAASRVAKGARGLWYGFRGKSRMTNGFTSEGEAQSALDGLGD